MGKASRDMKQAVVPYGGKEVFVESFEVLVLLSSTAPGIAPQQPFRWITVPSGAFNTGAGAPIEAGYEEDGKPIYVASTHVNGNSVQPGKVST